MEKLAVKSKQLLLALLLLCPLQTVNCDRTENEERYLRIPALGRTAHLGHLYNEVLDEFRDVSVFSQTIPEEFITKALKPKLTTISGPANTYQEKFKLLNIQETVAANVLSGFTELDGSAKFLNDETFQKTAPTEFSGALIQKYRTVKESLQIYYSNLTRLYNSAVLNHKEATHVVTGIEWGADTVVHFKSPSHGSHNELQEQIKKFEGSQSEWTDSNATFSMSILSDISVPFAFSQNLTQVYNMLQQIPEKLKTINEGKGIPVKYVLTPLTVIKRFVLPGSKPSNSANEINTWLLIEIISYYDKILSLQRQTNLLSKTLNSQPNCLLAEAKQKFESFQKSLQTFGANLTRAFQDALKADRIASGPNVALRQLSQEFSSNQFDGNSLQEQFSEFNSDLKRTEFCARLAVSYPQIKYVGYEQSLDLEISQHFNQSVYVLFTKAEFTSKNTNEWQENLSTFLYQLNQPGNKMYIVDCDKQAMCVNVSQSVIHLYRNGRLLSPKVERVYEEEVDELKLQISHLNSTLVNVSESTAALTAQLFTVKREVIRNRNDINSQLAGLEKVNKTAIQNENIINGAKCETRKPVFIVNATKSASFGCGGTIQLPSKEESIVVDFNLAPTTDAFQRCLWTLDATKNNERVFFKVKVTLLCKHPTRTFDDSTLTFTEWHWNPTNKEITTNRLSSSSLNSFLLSKHFDYRGYLSFNSKTTHSEAGFILRLDVLDAIVSSSQSSWSATQTESVGSASFSLPTASYGFSSIVINPQPVANLTLTVDVDSIGDSNPCLPHESVDILEFGMDGVPKTLGRLCGQQSGISYKTENPVAALLLWPGRKSGQGVKLSWK